jgi:hypothetical protein
VEAVARGIDMASTGKYDGDTTADSSSSLGLDDFSPGNFFSVDGLSGGSAPRFRIRLNASSMRLIRFAQQWVSVSAEQGEPVRRISFE